MKKTITKLMAALALLLFVAPPLVGWGQTYSLYSGQLVEGDYLIYYNGKAMNTTTSSNRLQYNEVTPADDVITTEQTNIVWHIAPDGEYWTIYNASEGLYAVSNGTKNQATTSTTLDDKARWTVTGTSTYEFVNKYNNDNNVNKNLRNNGTYGFACYSTSTGGALSLYKLEESPVGTPSITANNVEIDYNATGGQIEYSINNPVDGGALTAEVTEGEWLENLQVGETVTFNCDPNQAAAPRTATVTLTYTYNTDQTVTKNVTVTQAGNPNAPGTQNNPYTVAQARAAIDAGTGTQGVYATGIVSVIPTAYSTQYGNITFNMVDEEGDEVFLQAYRCGGDQAANVTVGDVVVVYGNLTKYGSTYEFAQGCEVVSLEHPTVIVAAPTFSPVGGTYIEAQTVEISTATEGADIYYTLDGTEPTTNSTVYENSLQISETTTIKAIAVDGDDNASTVATATYHICSANSPYTVTQALNFIEYPTSTIWVHGIVSTAPTSAPNSNGQLTYYISDDGTANDQLQVYKGLGLNNEAFTLIDDIQVGDIVTITGIVKIYNNTKEFDAGNYLVSFERPQSTVPSITVTPDLVELDANDHDGTLDLAYVNLTITEMKDFDIQYYDAQGQELNGDDVPAWIEVLVAEQDPTIGEGYVVSYYMIENEGEARSAYFKVYAMDDETNLVYSNLVTVNQEAYVAPATEGWVLANLSDLTENDVFVIVGNNGSNYAMPNNNGTSGAPAAIKVTVENEALTGNVPDSIQWNIGITDDGYVFYPNGQTEAWLYCTDANNGVRVGTNDAKVFSLDEETGYLKHNGTGRYIGVYNSQDWRCYTNTTVNIAGQTFAFYKKIVPTETYTLNVNGYGESETNGYVLLASPVYVKTETTGMTTGEFDLYYFDQSEVGYEWRNFEVEEGQFNLIPGKGYLYANSTDVELTFTGTPYSGDGSVSLVKDDNAVWSGWNLVGNPFGTTAYLDRDFYAMNEDGTEIMTDASQGAVAAMQGIFVIAENNGETLTFTTETPAQEEANVTLNLSQNRGAVIDRTIVRFGEGRQLPKFQLNAESTKLYIPQGNNDYAVVRSAAQGEMPVNFKAQSNGTYTISIDAENVEMNYLHLIDNMTGADVDLLATPSYTFDAKTTDYASRFKLVFSANANENDDENETFAFFNGSVWCISNTGEATLQVVDMLGRIVSSESVNGNATLSTDNLMSGVYMFRLVNGENVKVQKVVVK